MKFISYHNPQPSVNHYLRYFLEKNIVVQSLNCRIEQIADSNDFNLPLHCREHNVPQSSFTTRRCPNVMGVLMNKITYVVQPLTKLIFFISFLEPFSTTITFVKLSIFRNQSPLQVHFLLKPINDNVMPTSHIIAVS